MRGGTAPTERPEIETQPAVPFVPKGLWRVLIQLCTASLTNGHRTTGAVLPPGDPAAGLPNTARQFLRAPPSLCTAGRVKNFSHFSL